MTLERPISSLVILEPVLQEAWGFIDKEKLQKRIDQLSQIAEGGIIGKNESAHRLAFSEADFRARELLETWVHKTYFKTPNSLLEQ